MAVTPNIPKQITLFSWGFSWSSDLEDPTYYIYVNGKLYLTTENTRFIYTQTSGMLFVEVFDNATDRPSDVITGKVEIYFKGVPDTQYYRIDKCVAGEWVEQARVMDLDQGYFKWLSDFLDDVTEYVFQVVPVGVNGNAGSGLPFICLVVRVPNIPDLDVTYSDITHKLTISA